MDLVIVDFDCQALTAGQERIRELLKLPEGTEVFFMEGGGLEERQWELPEGAAENIGRCVFLTGLTGGIKKYHRDLFANNPQILSWIIAILDVEYESYKKQFLGQVDQAFGESDAYYDVVFDSSDALRETGRRCALPVKTRRRCLIVSKNRKLAQRVKDVMEGYLPSWETAALEAASAEDYRFADAAVVVGEKTEELAVPAPIAGLNRRFVWLDRGFLVPEEREGLTAEVKEIMNGCGWNIADYSQCLYSSDFLYESLYREIRDGKIGYSALVEHEDFVMWDVYGLPLVRKEYTQERIAGFLDENCCFTRIAERISAKKGRRV